MPWGNSDQLSPDRLVTRPITTMSGDDPQLLIRQLERQLAAVTKERDDLAVDVEQLCVQRGSHMFSSSYVVSERLKFLDSQLQEQRLALRKMTAERDSLLEDILQFRASKKQSDEGWAKEQQRAAALEKELAFFKSSSVKAISERDQAAFDARTYKTELEAAADSIKDTKARLAAAESNATELQGKLASTEQRLAVAESQQQELGACRVQLRQQQQAYEQQLQRCKQRLDQLQLSKVQLSADLDTARATAGVLEEELQDSRAEMAAAQQQGLKLKQANQQLHSQLNAASAQVQDLQTLLEQTSAALVASQARLKETHGTSAAAGSSGSPDKSASALQEEVASLKAQLAETESLLTQAARDKLEVQLELSKAQAGEDEYSHTLQQLTEQYQTVKAQLETATQEKVEALLQAASRQAALHNGSGHQHQQLQDTAPAGPPATPPLSKAAQGHGAHVQAGGMLPLQAKNDQQQQQQQAQGSSQQDQASAALAQAVGCLQQALGLAHHYRCQLQQLKAADIAAVASSSGGQGSAAKGKGGKKGPVGAAEAAAPADPLSMLAALAHELEVGQHQLQVHAGLNQQQLEGLAASLLHQQQQASVTPVTLPAPASPIKVNSSSGSGGPDSSRRASPVLGMLLKATKAVSSGNGSGNMAAAGATRPSDPLLLAAALEAEVHLLAECGVSALRYIPKMTALNTLMQGGW